MKAKNPITISDLNWLPSYGENGVNCISKSSELYVEVLFDDEDSGNEAMKTLKFSGVCFFMLASVPGVDLLSIQYDKVSDPGVLIEFKNSEPADKWMSHFKRADNKIRHFQIYFLAVNQRLEVFASDFLIV
jgi:hypothetical protein